MIWTDEAAQAGAVPAEIIAAIESRGLRPSVHAGPEPPGGPADVIVRWTGAETPETLAGLREALRSGLARAAVLAAPGTRGMAPGNDPQDGRDESRTSLLNAVAPSAGPGPSVIRIDPEWGAEAAATVVEAALDVARARARVEALAEDQESFVAIASHDLRTPVSTLRLLLDLFRSSANARSDRLTPRELSEFDELLVIMERNLDKMDAFVGDIVDAWRVYRGGPEVVREPVSLNSVVEDIVAGLFPSAMQKDIALDLVTDGAVRPVMAETRRVGQVVSNLVANAIKYTPHGGAVEVRTRPAPDEPGAILEVADTGPGVPEEERDGLFRRFARGSARATGGEPSTGLGLFICREIVETYGGRIWYEPAPAAQGEEAAVNGSRFLVFWPAARGQEASSPHRTQRTQRRT